MTEDEIVGWHHGFNGHEFEQTQGDTEGQGSLLCCGPYGHKELDRTQRLYNNNSGWTKALRTPAPGKAPSELASMVLQDIPQSTRRTRHWNTGLGLCEGALPKALLRGALVGGTFLSRGAPAWLSLTLDNQEDLTFQWKLWKPPRAFPCWSLRFKKGVNGDLQFPSRSGPV